MEFSAIAPAKLTLYLHITGKREDGYHELDSLFAFSELGDKVRVEADDALKLTVDGPFAASVPSDENNLVMKAASMLQERLGVEEGAHIYLTKDIPVGAGLGGGSSDAATVMRLLCQLWNVPVPVRELAEMGVEIGADVPACIYAAPVWVSGIGEVVEPAPNLPSLPMVLVWPNASLATPDVYRQFQFVRGQFTKRPEIEDELTAMCLLNLSACRNDLQHTAITLEPDIANVLLELDTQINCEFARMAGSGSSCFAFFTDEESARMAAKRLAEHYPEWWVQATVLRGGNRLKLAS